MRRAILTVLMILLGGLIWACSSVPKGEREIMSDATPPQDYNPIFVQTVKPFAPDKVVKPAIVVSGVDTKSPNNIKIRFNIIDDGKFHLAGASQQAFKNIWCFVVDSVNGVEKPLKNYKIREVREDDHKPVSLALVADHSGSMGEWRAKTVQKALDDLIRGRKNPEDEFAIIKYDQKTVKEVPLTNLQPTILSQFQMNGLEGYGGMTAISDGIYAGLDELRRSNPRNQRALAIFTDGWDNSSTLTQDSVIFLARSINANIYPIDFGVDINDGYMKNFADSTGVYYHHIYSTDEFKLVFNDIYSRLKNHYVLEVNPSDYGNHKLKLKLCLPKDSLYTEVNFSNIPDIGSVGLINIYFDLDKSVIKKGSEEALESIVMLMKAFPKMVIEIRGHTDSLNSTKDPAYNMKLSQKRADEVKQALIKKGIDEARIMSKGYGDTMPVAENSTEEGRMLNRRTEFAVIRK